MREEHSSSFLPGLANFFQNSVKSIAEDSTDIINSIGGSIKEGLGSTGTRIEKRKSWLKGNICVWKRYGKSFKIFWPNFIAVELTYVMNR